VGPLNRVPYVGYRRTCKPGSFSPKNATARWSISMAVMRGYRGYKTRVRAPGPGPISTTRWPPAEASVNASQIFNT